MDIEKLKYPIGKKEFIKHPDEKLFQKWIKDIESFPIKVEKLTNGISIEKLNWKYRPNGWTVKQVIHHCADSHINAIIRFKLTLTEDTPTIRPYREDMWAELIDAKDNDIKNSILLLKGLHNKWVCLLNELSVEQLKLEYFHPDFEKKFDLIEIIGLYAWHCNHHLTHIKNGINSNGEYN